MTSLKSTFLLCSSFLIFSGCSHQNDYTPSPETSGEQIFAEVCKNCHQPDSNGIIYTLKKEDANLDYIRQKIKQGSMMMPKFPNMTDDAITKVGKYVLAHSQSE
jgi:mono/diheme cytochrome c family protein